MSLHLCISGFGKKTLLVTDLEEYWPYKFKVTAATVKGDNTSDFSSVFRTTQAGNSFYCHVFQFAQTMLRGVLQCSGSMFPHPVKVFELGPVFKLSLNCPIFTNLGNYLSYLQNNVDAESVDYKFEMLDYVKTFVAD